VSEPNGWLPDATGRATNNNYDYTSQNGQNGSQSGAGAHEVGRALAFTAAGYAVRRYGPKLAKAAASALRGLVR
jgi:hypothetical protein